MIISETIYRPIKGLHIYNKGKKHINLQQSSTTILTKTGIGILMHMTI